MALIGEFGAAVREADPDAEQDTFTFYGESFTVADRVGAMPLLKFAAVAEAGTEAEEMGGLAAMHELLRDCLAPGDWAKFQKAAADNKASAEELMEVCAAIYQAVTGKDTRQPSASTAGSSRTGASSKATSSSRASSAQKWKKTPFGQREMAADPDRYKDVMPINAAAKKALARTG